MANYACIPYLITREFDDQGKLLAFGKVYTYQAGTTIPLQTYADAGGFATNLNPVVLDASGSANIFLKGQAYKFVFKDANDNLIRTIDNVLGTASASGGSMVVVSNYAALRALTTDFDVVVVLGRDTPDDGGYGVFEQVPFAADDDGVVLNRALVTSYKRQFAGSIDPRWFGVQYNVATAQNAAILKAQAASANYTVNPSLGGVRVRYEGGVVYINALTINEGYVEIGDMEFRSVSGNANLEMLCNVVVDTGFQWISTGVNALRIGVTPKSNWFGGSTELDRYNRWRACALAMASPTFGQAILNGPFSLTTYGDFDLPANISLEVQQGAQIEVVGSSRKIDIKNMANSPDFQWIGYNGNTATIPTMSFPIPAKPEWFAQIFGTNDSNAVEAAMRTGKCELSKTYVIATAKTFPSAVVSSAIPSGVTGQSTFSGPALRFLANCTIPQLTANGIELYADATSRLTVTTLCATECFFNSSLVPLAFATTTAYLENCLTLAGISGVVKKSNCRQTGLDLWETTDANVTSLYMVYDKRIIETVSGGITITDATSSNVIADNSAGNISLNMAASTLIGVSYRRVIAYTKANTVTITGTFWDGTSTVGSVTLGGANSVWADFIPRAGGWYILRGA